MTVGDRDQPLSTPIAGAGKPAPRWRRALRRAYRPNVLLILTIVLAFPWTWGPTLDNDYSRLWSLGLSREAVASGRWWTILSAMWVHAGLWHIGMNLFALWPLGNAVGLRCEPGPRGAVRYYALYLLSGIAGGLTYLALHMDGTVPTVGASGAIFGLAGALGRLQAMEAGETRLISRHILRFAWPLIKSNLILIALFAALSYLTGGGGLAWEAHLGGFIGGFLLAPLFARPLPPIEEQDDGIPAVFLRD